ncbi:hypothetical protein MJK72_05180 [Klebsiella pneumoniae]|nr:hypothetical protein MJK72_05180 [Klebsiella pneumoniae]
MSEDISSTDSQAAHNLALSIDERLQATVYRELNNAVAFINQFHHYLGSLRGSSGC